jgi:hypothetical protein
MERESGSIKLRVFHKYTAVPPSVKGSVLFFGIVTTGKSFVGDTASFTTLAMLVVPLESVMVIDSDRVVVPGLSPVENTIVCSTSRYVDKAAVPATVK